MEVLFDVLALTRSSWMSWYKLASITEHYITQECNSDISPETRSVPYQFPILNLNLYLNRIKGLHVATLSFQSIMSRLTRTLHSKADNARE